MKRKGSLHQSHSSRPVSLGPSSLAGPRRPDNGGVSGTGYCVIRTVWSVLCGQILPLTLFAVVTVHRPTPRPIHALRCCPVSTVPGLSGTRYGRYSSGSRSFAFGCCERVYAGSAAMSIFQVGKMRVLKNGESALYSPSPTLPARSRAQGRSSHAHSWLYSPQSHWLNSLQSIGRTFYGKDWDAGVLFFLLTPPRWGTMI